MIGIEQTFLTGTTVPIPSNFRCPLCSRDFTTRGFASHIGRCCKKHDITTAEYERRHPMQLYSPIHQFAAKWFSLARFSITEFGLMNYANCYWYHVHADEWKPCFRAPWGRKPETLPLLMFDATVPHLRRAFHHFREHLRGNLTLGIWPDMDNRYTIIDLDNDQAARWMDLRERLIDLSLHFYIVYSGKKGVHFWIFWNRDLPNTELVELHNFLCDGIPSDHNCWPFKRSIIKLPLGLHRGTSKLSCFLDYDGNPIPLNDQFNYFLDIKTNSVPIEYLNRTDEDLFEPIIIPQIIPISAEKVEDIPPIEEEVSDSIPTKKMAVKQNPSAYESCLLHNTKLSCGRHQTLFYLAIHLKENRKIDMIKAVSILEEWSARVPSKHSLKERLRDARSTVMRVFEKGITRTSLVQSKLTEKEVRVIQCVLSSSISVCVAVGSRTRKEDLSKRLKTATKVALTMASLSKTQKGRLEISYRTLSRLAGVSMNTLRRSLQVLVEDIAARPPENQDYDPVFWNMDMRPKRTGIMFLCLRRGTYSDRLNSMYQMKEPVIEMLGWT